MFSVNNFKCAIVIAAAILSLSTCKSNRRQKPAPVTDLRPAYSAYYQKGNFKEAIVLASLAAKTFANNKNTVKEAASMLLVSEAQIMLADYNSANKSLNSSRKLLKDFRNDSLKTVYDILKGDVFTAFLKADSAKLYYEAALVACNHAGTEELKKRLCLSNIQSIRHAPGADTLLNQTGVFTANGATGNYYKLLICYQRIQQINNMGSPDSATRLIRILKQNIDQYYPRNNYLLTLLYSAFSRCGMSQMDYNTSISYAREELSYAHHYNNGPELFTAYFDLQEAYLYNQDTKNVKVYADSAGVVLKQTYTARSRQASRLNSTYSRLYDDTHDYDKSLDNIRKNILLDSIVFGSNSDETAKDYQLMANLYSYKQQFKQAVVYSKKILGIRQKLFADDNLEIGFCMDDMARYYNNMNQPKKALPLQQAVEKIYIKNYGYKHSYVAWAYDAEADSYGQLRQFKKAMLYNNMALQLFIPDIMSDSTALNRTALIPFDIYIPDYLSSRMEILYNHSLAENNKAERIRILKQAYELSIAENNYIRSYSDHFDSPESIATIYQRMNDYDELCADVCDDLFELTGDAKYRTGVLNFSENKRGSFLRSGILSAKTIQFSGVPDTILSREKSLKKELKSMFAKDIPQSKRDSIKMRYDAFIKMLSANYPDYYKLKYISYTLNESQVQHWLPDASTVYAEYMIGHNNIYLMVISKSQSSLIKLKKDDSLLAQVSGLHNILKQDDPRHYYKSAYSIYKNLVQPMEPYIKKGSKVIISADGELSTLSFEALVTRPKPAGAGFNTADFLFNNYNFSYAVSAFSLLNPFQKKAAVKGKDKVYYSAPGFDDNLKAKYEAFAAKMRIAPDQSYLSYLYQPFMLKLGNSLADSWNITKDEGGRATEADFKEKAPSNNVIQVGSHALLNDIDPMRSCLVFAKELSSDKNSDDGYLYSSEIYNQKLNADLVILTACETGGGKFKEGEGMMSLAYSFEYAGCKSAMMSLWPIDEKTSASITENFYKHLGKGESTGTALYNAKKDFLASAAGPMVNPFYWSGLVMLGQDQLIRLEKNDEAAGFKWAFAAAVIIAAGALSFRSVKKKQAA